MSDQEVSLVVLAFRFDPQTAVIGLDYIRFSQVAHVAVADSGER